MDNPTETQGEKAPESRAEKPVEAKENTQEQLYAGAEILENPPQGSFVMGLQAFVAWVQDLVAKKN